MQFEDILQRASKHGFNVDKYSTQRAWIKSAFLYIECYVTPALGGLYAKEKGISENITLGLLKELFDHKNAMLSDPEVKPGVQTRKGKRKSSYQLPTRKKFLSVKNLCEKNSKPCHSCITLKDYNASDNNGCSQTGWTT
uniref:Uncharacterized protein n=1 Tax=Ciona savignyi TaxID=51511 RepID=H2ZHQ1_CIOSA